MTRIVSDIGGSSRADQRPLWRKLRDLVLFAAASPLLLVMLLLALVLFAVDHLLQAPRSVRTTPWRGGW